MLREHGVSCIALDLEAADPNAAPRLEAALSLEQAHP
jgi:hypothetical protein